MDHSLKHAMLLQHRQHGQPQTLKLLSSLRSKLQPISYHLRTLWLFNVSDLKTIVGPCTGFAVFQRLGLSAFAHNDAGFVAAPPMSISQLLMVIVWLYVTLLAETIANQRKGIEEDRLNKPWRPLPAGRLTSDQAKIWMVVAYMASISFGFICGAHVESITLLFLGVWYNELNGSGSSWFTRNFLNACGICCFLSGAFASILYTNQQTLNTNTNAQHPIVQNATFRTWFAIIWLVIITGIQVQDLPDQEGDAKTNRKTMPLVISDIFTRYTVAITTLFWSFICPYFWCLSFTGYIAPLTLGCYITWRTLAKKDVKHDKLTYKLWNLWFAVFFTLPMQSS